MRERVAAGHLVADLAAAFGRLYGNGAEHVALDGQPVRELVPRRARPAFLSRQHRDGAGLALRGHPGGWELGQRRVRGWADAHVMEQAWLTRRACHSIAAGYRVAHAAAVRIVAIDTAKCAVEVDTEAHTRIRMKAQPRVDCV